MPTRRAVLAGALLAGADAVAARAQPSERTLPERPLRVTWRDAILDLDPYRNQLRTGLVLAHHVWDCLLDRDPDTLQLRPLLATDWGMPDDTSIEFTLRPGVRFHDGSPFTAEDVAYTVRTVLTDPAVAVPGLFAWLSGVRVLDDTHVRLHLTRPFPPALEYLAMALPILPRAYREQAGPAGFSAAPVGTGPYQITAVQDGGRRIALERSGLYFDGGPKSRPAIAHIAIHQVADAQAEFTDLLSDNADWVWLIGPSEFEALQHTAGLQTLRADSMRLGYLSLDAAGRSDPASPLTSLKVRQAVLHALDRAEIARRVGAVATRVPEAPCYPTQFGCDAAAAPRYPYDPDRAKALLAEAGYQDGFRTELVSYVVAQDGEAVRSYLQAVGIAAELRQMSTSDALARAEAGQAPLFLGNWGSYSINDVAAILPHFFGGGALDYARRPELQSLIDRADITADADQRRGLYSQAIRLITQQALWTPTHTYATTYAFNRALNFRAYADELPRFYLANWRAG